MLSTTHIRNPQCIYQPTTTTPAIAQPTIQPPTNPFMSTDSKGNLFVTADQCGSQPYIGMNPGNLGLGRGVTIGMAQQPNTLRSCPIISALPSHTTPIPQKDMLITMPNVLCGTPPTQPPSQMNTTNTHSHQEWHQWVCSNAGTVNREVTDRVQGQAYALGTNSQSQNTTGVKLQAISLMNTTNNISTETQPSTTSQQTLSHTQNTTRPCSNT